MLTRKKFELISAWLCGLIVWLLFIIGLSLCGCGLKICKTPTGKKKLCINTCMSKDKCGCETYKIELDLLQIMYDSCQDKKSYLLNQTEELLKNIKDEKFNIEHWKDLNKEKMNLLKTAYEDLLDCQTQVKALNKQIDQYKKRIKFLEKLLGK